MPPILSGITGGGTVELGQHVTLTVRMSGTPTTPLTYQWRKNGDTIVGATSSSFEIAAVTAADAGTYTITVTNADGSSVATTDVTVKPLAAPVFTTQPRSLVLQVGQTATFSFAATGSYPRTYQWHRNGTPIPGATQSAYTITGISTSDAAGYSVVVANSAGSATSATASLTVNAATPPVLDNNYPFDRSVTRGATVNFSPYISTGSSPFTYQWLKAGVPIPGATDSQLTFTAVADADAGRYSVVVNNVAGSATSREATLTVTPPSPITFNSQPSSATLFQGQSLSLSVSVSGSSPVTYQWNKNNVALAGATNNTYYINAVALDDAGSYTVTMVNPAGSVTSNAAVVVVNAPVPPAITTQPVSQTVVFNGSFNLSVQVTGSPPLTYTWKKDGTAITGANSTSYSVFGATPAQSGSYTVTVSNAGGAVTSNPAVVLVTAAVPPTITSQPADREVNAGLSASFSVSVNSVGAGQLTFQWLKDGKPIPNAVSSSYYIAAAKEIDAGTYAVVITGPGGSVTSAAAKLSVLPPAPPSVQSWPTGFNYVSLGGSARLGFGSPVNGTPPFTYQWAKNGVAIPGATNTQLYFASIASDDIATYTVTVSNDAGVITSPGWRLRVGTAAVGTTILPWADVGRVGDIVYFLAMSPSRIERYDLAGERWLPTTLLSDTLVPTAFVPAPEGVYIAYGRTLVRRPLDLTGETAIANAPADVSQMFVFGDFLYYRLGSSNGSVSGTQNYNTLNRSTLQAGPGASIGYYGGYSQVALAPALGRGFGRTTGVSPSDIEMFNFAADGTVSGSKDSPYHGTMPGGSRAFVLPGEQLVADDSGTVYRAADLTYAGSFGEPMTDLAFFDDGTPVVLRNGWLTTTRTDTFTETARYHLARPALRIFTHGNSVFAFGAASGTAPFAAVKVGASDLEPAAVPAISLPASTRFSIDDAFVADDGTVAVFSRTLQAFLRWNPTTRSFLPSVPLRMAPSLVYDQDGNRRALVLYPDGVITAVPLGADAGPEQALANTGHYVRALVDLGDSFTVNYSDAQDSGDGRMILGGSGGSSFINTSLYEGTGLAWLPAPRRLYSVPAFFGSLQYEHITTAGALDSTTGARGSFSDPVTPPIRFNPEGTLLVTMNGRVLNADLAAVGVLGNNVTDAAWLPGGLYTIRSVAGQTEIQQWARTTYLLNASATLSGLPIRLLRLSDTRLLVVSSDRGFLELTLVNPDLSIDAPPPRATFAGVYMAKFAGAVPGDLALYVRADGTAVLLGHLPGLHTALFASAAAIGDDGTFVISAEDLGAGNTRAIAGTLASDGSFSGSIPSLNLSFSGTQASGSGLAGYYAATAVNGGFGAAYAITAPDGHGLYVAQNASALDGGMSTIDASGNLTIATMNGAELEVVLNSATGSLTATAGSGALATTTFAGLRDGVARTDRLANISTRGRAASGDDALIAGFVVNGSAPRTILLRAVGPALHEFGVGDAMADPKLTLFRGDTQVAESDNWSSESSANTLVSVADRVGAFALPSPGLDAALLVTLEPGAYTAKVGAATGGSGVSLVEVYDAGDGSGDDVPRVVNISTRGRAGTGEEALIAGIVVSGNAPKKLLVRGIGPTLDAFHVSDTLADPVLTILSGQTPLLVNDDWSLQSGDVSPGDIAAAATTVGAFGLSPSSKDAALLITLQPGNYTAQLTGKGTASGIALIEVYELPN